MTAEQRTRLYCCFRACPVCGAHRGEYCKSKRSYGYQKSYHWQRGPYALFGSKMRWTPAERRLYPKLRSQILAEGPIPDHE